MASMTTTAPTNNLDIPTWASFALLFSGLILGPTGQILQKIAISRDGLEQFTLFRWAIFRQYFCNCTWMTGQFCCCMLTPITWVTLQTLPLAVSNPINQLYVLIVALLAWRYLHQEFTLRHGVASLILVAAAAGIAYSTEEVGTALSAPPLTPLWLAVTAAHTVILLLELVLFYVTKRNQATVSVVECFASMQMGIAVAVAQCCMAGFLRAGNTLAAAAAGTLYVDNVVAETRGLKKGRVQSIQIYSSVIANGLVQLLAVVLLQEHWPSNTRQDAVRGACIAMFLLAAIIWHGWTKDAESYGSVRHSPVTASGDTP